MLIAIYGSRRQNTFASEIQRLLRTLVIDGARIVMHPKLYRHLEGELGLSMSGVECGSEKSVPENTDLTLSIGGDGTFLRTAAWVAPSEIPILGINTGNLGYLSALSAKEAIDLADDILSRDYSVEPRTLLQVESAGIEKPMYALNEAVVAKEDSSSMVWVNAFINDVQLANYRSDGLIVSTPTGSTAYNLSAGGPIVQPTAPVWVVTPICAHSLGMRPLVIGDNNVLRLCVDGRGRCFRLSIDGRSVNMEMGQEVVLKRAPFRTLIVQRRGNEFPGILRSKLLFS